MADWAHEWTDGEIERLERKFRRQYNQAAREMCERLEDMMKTFDKENSEWQDKVKSGEASKKDYEKWLQDQLTDQDFVRGMSSELSKQANQANQLAMQTINDMIPSVFAENANYAAFGIERSIGKNTHSFDLYDQDTVRRLIAEQPELLPPLQRPKMDNGRDLRWNKQKFASAITQSILQGESIPRAAERIGRVMRTNEAAAVRAARTAITGAENAGRVDSYKRAERIGIELEQEWMATFDNRTRLSHRELHGQHVPVGKYFVASRTTGNKLLYPGDPTADPSEVYNCRCTLVAWFPNIEQEEKPLWTDWKDGTTYDEWKAGKIHEAERKETSGVVDGKNILGTWKRRSSEFDFEIDDVLHAQGFDGLPKVVSPEEFDAAVKAANDGNGLIMQRAYSAPDQETLDAYREALYRGKWYVDCSTNGAFYGQGMYATPSWDGTITDGLREAADFYTRLNSNPVSNVEQMTLHPSAKIVNFYDIVPEHMRYVTQARFDAQNAEKTARENLENRFFDELIGSVARDVGLAESQMEDFTYFVKASAGRVDADWGKMSSAANAIGSSGVNAAMRVQSEYASGVNEYRRENLEQELSRIATMQEVENVGSYAALQGYDAIRVDEGIGGGEIVVLNRTKLIIKEQE